MESNSYSVYNRSDRNSLLKSGHSVSSGFNESSSLNFIQNQSDPHSAQSRLFNVSEINNYISSESFEDTYTGCFSSSIYLFRMQSVPIPLPEDYKDSLMKIIDTFAEKLTRLPGAMSHKIGKRIEKCSKAMNQVIYNLNINLLALLSDIENRHNEHQSQLADNIIKYFNQLLDNSINELKMPTKAKKLFMFEVVLEPLKEPFIQKCVEKKSITLEWFWEELQKDFSPFIKDKPQIIPYSIRSIYDNFLNEIKNINNSLIEDIRNLMFSILLFLNYQRVGLFAMKLTEDLEYCESNWVLFASLILQGEPVSFQKPISLSPSAILIPLTLNRETLLVLLEKVQSSVIGRIESRNLLVASGSTREKIFISLNDLLANSEYFIEMGRLRLRSNFDMKFKSGDRVTSSLYIESQNKLIFVVSKTDIYSKKLDSDRIVVINFKPKDESIESALYFRESKLICLKTYNYLFLFNDYFQIVQQVEVLGNIFESVFLMNVGALWVFDIKKAVEFRFSQNRNAENKKVPENYEILKCKYSISRDFLYSMPSGSKYIPFVQNRFMVPDFNNEFLKDFHGFEQFKSFKYSREVKEDSVDQGVKEENSVDQGVKEEKIVDQGVKEEKIVDQGVKEEKIIDQGVKEEKKENIVDQGVEDEEKGDYIELFYDKPVNFQRELNEESVEVVVNLNEPEGNFFESNKVNNSEVQIMEIIEKEEKKLHEFKEESEDIKRNFESAENEFSIEPEAKFAENQIKENLEELNLQQKDENFDSKEELKENDHKDESISSKDEYKESEHKEKSIDSEEKNRETTSDKFKDNEYESELNLEGNPIELEKTENNFLKSNLKFSSNSEKAEISSHTTSIIDPPVEIISNEFNPSLNIETTEIKSEFPEIVEVRTNKFEANEVSEYNQKLESSKISHESEKPELEDLSLKSSNTKVELKPYEKIEESKISESCQNLDDQEEISESKYELIEKSKVSETFEVSYNKIPESTEDLPIVESVEILEESKHLESSIVPLESSLFSPESMNVFNPVPEANLSSLSSAVNLDAPYTELNNLEELKTEKTEESCSEPAPMSSHIENPQIFPESDSFKAELYSKEPKSGDSKSSSSS